MIALALTACSSGGSSGGVGSCDQTCSSHDVCPKLACPCLNLPFNGTTQSCRGGCCVTSCDELCPKDAGTGGSAGSAGGAAGEGGTAGAAGADAGPSICLATGAVLLGTNESQAFGMTVDADSVYWTNNVGTVTKLAKSSQTPVVLATGLDGAKDIVEQDGILYLRTTDEIAILPAAGGTPKTQSVTSLFNTPTSIAVDASDIYFGGNQGIGKMPLSGDSISWFLSGENGCYAEGLVLDDGYVYSAACDLWRIPKSGPPKEQLAPFGHLLDGLAQDGQNLYFIDPGPSGSVVGDVIMVPKTGGAPVTLALQESRPAHPTLADGELYWASFGDADCTGSIRKVDTTGTPVVTTVVSGISYVQALALDQTSVYFTSGDGTIRMAPR
jgi:hypothetical protein